EESQELGVNMEGTEEVVSHPVADVQDGYTSSEEEEEEEEPNFENINNLSLEEFNTDLELDDFNDEH
ncbi:MAG: hypothetical protein ACRC7R_10575, partial [Sarcina sp.]